jgi:hypothetical protein
MRSSRRKVGPFGQIHGPGTAQTCKGIPMTSSDPPEDPRLGPAGPPNPGPPGQPYPGQPGFGQPYPGQLYPGQPGPGPMTDPAAPYGRHPVTGEPFSDKQKVVAGLLQIFLGTVGAGRWYLGDNGIALAQLFTCGGLGVWALIDGIMMLTGNVRDKQGRPLRD